MSSWVMPLEVVRGGVTGWSTAAGSTKTITIKIFSKYLLFRIGPAKTLETLGVNEGE